MEKELEVSVSRKKKVKLIYNKFSGNGIILEHLDKIIETYQKYGYFIEIFRISYDTNIEKIIDNHSEYDHYLISGGDGTVNHVVNVLKKNGIEIPIGILPYGTANDFSTLFHMPKDPVLACERIINSQGKNIDLGVINGEYFLNVASVGIFSEASHNISPGLKKMGKIGYYLNGAKDAAKLTKMNVRIKWDGGDIIEEVLAILIFNGKSVGLIHLAKNASLEDGEFDVLVIKPHNILQLIEIFGKVVASDELTEPLKGLQYFKTKNILIENCEDTLHSTDIDGEKGPSMPLDVGCIGGGLRVLGYE